MLKTLQGKLKLQRLIGDWNRYRQITVMALEGKTLPPGAESEFLKLKARIALRIEEIRVVSAKKLDAEAWDNLEAMEKQLARHWKLTSVQGEGRWSIDEFESMWNAHFIALNRLRGISLFSRPRPAKPRKVVAAPTGYKKPRVRRHVPVGRVVKNLFALAVTAVILWRLGLAMGVQRGEGRFELKVVDPPKTIKESLGNVAEAFYIPWQPKPDAPKVPPVARAAQPLPPPPEPELGAILVAFSRPVGRG